MEYVIIILVVVVVAYFIFGRVKEGRGDLPTSTSVQTKVEPKQLDPVDIPMGYSTQKRTTTKPPKSFSKMTKAELLAYAEENGIDVSKSDTKAEIVKKIKLGF